MCGRGHSTAFLCKGVWLISQCSANPGQGRVGDGSDRQILKWAEGGVHGAVLSEAQGLRLRICTSKVDNPLAAEAEISCLVQTYPGSHQPGTAF